MGVLYGFHERFSAAQTEDNTLILLSETLIRGAGCLNWARPGLRGLRVGNCPVLLGVLTIFRIVKPGKDFERKRA